MGFSKSRNDACLYIKNGGTLTLVCVWVDDIVLCSKTKEEAERFKRNLEDKFTISEFGKLRWFLGMRIRCDDGFVSVNQEDYIKQMLLRYGMSECKPIGTPGVSNAKLSRADSPEADSEDHREMAKYDYRGLVGCLNYLSTTTRPDVAYMAHLLSRYLHNPGKSHWIAAKHVLRYLQATKKQELVYRRTGDDIDLHAYSDSDYAGDVDTRRSTSGLCVFMSRGSAAISWQSKLQSTVAVSTAEAEINAAVASVQEMVHLNELLKELGYSLDLPILLYVDNQAAIALSRNPEQQSKTKHFAIRLAYLRELCEKGFVTLEYIPSKEMIADILTKCLDRTSNHRLMKKLMGSIDDSNSGGVND